MSKDLEVLKADVKKLMLKDWTETEVTKLDEFMEDVIIATMQVNNLSIHIVVGRSEQLKAFVEWWHGLSQEELVWHEGKYVEVFLSEQLRLNGIANFVYVVTERDNYGEQLFKGVFANREKAVEFLAEHGLKESNIDEINKIEL